MQATLGYDTTSPSTSGAGRTMPTGVALSAHDLPSKAVAVKRLPRIPWDSGGPAHLPAPPSPSRSSSSPRCCSSTVAVGYTWYDAHLALDRPASPASRSPRITLTDRLTIEGWRLPGAGGAASPTRSPAAGSRTPRRSRLDRSSPARPSRSRSHWRSSASSTTAFPGEPRDRGGCLGQRRRHRRQAGRGGDDPGGAPPVGHRGRAGGERRRARADA